MKRILTLACALCFVAAGVRDAAAQGGIGGVLKGVKKGVDTVDSLTFTEAEERTLGEEISAKLRDKYGVVQDRNVHTYVSLVGNVIAAASSRPRLQWTFIVLDTDGINAFAVPGGLIHVTRGALALIQNEAELADVLGHEIIHVTAKHTLNAITKSKGLSTATSMTAGQKLAAAINVGYEMSLENAFDRGQEEAADKEGVALANKAGYTPTQMSAFLTKLGERNKGLKERSGVFASHRDTETRLDALKATISSQKLNATALVAPRYDAEINFTPVPVDKVVQVAPPTPGQPAKPAEQKSGGSGAFGLGGLNPLTGGKSGGAVSSAGARGANPDRDAKGGPNKGLVVVTVTAAEIQAFKAGIK